MTKRYKIALHIFRRDLRLVDNNALLDALEQADAVVPCFIFDPRQISDNDYKGQHCVQFMLQSLQELDAHLKKKNSQLYLFYGQPEQVLEKLINELNVDAVFVNRDYTPFSIARDKSLNNVCEKHRIALHSHADALLHEPEHTLKADKTPYSIFTHAFKRAAQLPVDKPRANPNGNYYHLPVNSADDTLLQRFNVDVNPMLAVKGGRKEGLVLLKRAITLRDYADIRNVPSLPGTTLLSAHNKFGTVSIREVYHSIVRELGSQHTLITELYWRDFFTHIAFHFPRVFKGVFHEKYSHLPWQNNAAHFQAWCQGQTGFPIVDAGMRELNATGYMHNRVRMITASFLVKDLHIDWRWGEQYFAQQLVDYDPAVNNGNWQWSASTGCDAQPYFRIFNPWLQQKKFDPECLYIKKWIPELADITPKAIHKWIETAQVIPHKYFHPIVDHSIETCKTEKTYREISQQY